MTHITHLQKDKRLSAILNPEKPATIRKRKKIYLRICSSILSQQLSTRVAEVLYARFLQLYDGKEPTLDQILNTPAEVLRSIGFSAAKASYIHNVCRFFQDNKLSDRRIHQMTDEEVLALLQQIKGVGKWTAEMILMFSLGREDVFSHGDLGLRQSVVRLYGLKETDPRALQLKIEKISRKWSPYRTYACLYLWNWKDAE